jgi:enamine deaminase RidA (YjgF/YER057c/UK114 family)
MEVRAINPPSLHRPPGDYSHAVQVGNLVFVTGQIPMDKQGRIPMRDFRAQTEQGYIVNLDMNFATFIEVSSKYRSKKLLPASTLIEVPSLVPRESMAEYEVVVALPGI